MASGSRYRFTLLGTKTFRFREMWTAVELVEASRCTCTSALKRAVVGPAEKVSLFLSGDDRLTDWIQRRTCTARCTEC